MSRNDLGQFEPGTSGNPRGRPRKLPRKINAHQLSTDFFEAAETLVPIVENGERKFIPVGVAIDKQLALKAASGDLRAIIEWKKTRSKLTVEYVKEQLGRLEWLLKSEATVRNYPEDVTDDFLALVKNVRLAMDPDYLP
jgi:Family of unknown function (DUF5681)